MLRVGIVGAGLIGNKRALALTKEDKIIAVADTNLTRAQTLASTYSAEATDDWKSLVARKDIDAVIVSTTNNAIPPIAIAALQNQKHVLVEKPAGRNPSDVGDIAQVAEKATTKICVGFNHRFHPGFQKAKALMQQKGAGELMYIRARYGHGGRVGYDKEWRANPELSGGGELLDQGVHLIDLCRFLGGEFSLRWGMADTFFWDMPVDDNGFMCLESPDKKKVAWLHASCSEWKNLFDFEVFCKTAKIQIAGLGRSYGTETLKYFQMKPEMGPPDITEENFPGEDNSWNLEWNAFKSEINGHATDIAKISDALKAVEIVQAVYRLS